jgi:membrane peptidoglycan carboxypeptidase
LKLAPPAGACPPRRSEPVTPASGAAPCLATAPEAWARDVSRRRQHRGFRVLRVAVVAVALAVATTVEASIVTGPNVGAVPTAVMAIDRTHASQAAMVAPPERIAAAIVAAEDDSFYTNDGIDVPALVRGLWGFVTGADTGGSTIEIQLAHLAFPGQTAGFWGRAHRVTLALQMDTHFSKQAILSMYLDAAYFGHGFYGVQAASLGYFGVPPSGLSWDQAALLAGLVQAPSQLDPFQHPQAARQRRAYVLQRLAAIGALTRTDADMLSTAPLQLA